MLNEAYTEGVYTAKDVLELLTEVGRPYVLERPRGHKMRAFYDKTLNAIEDSKRKLTEHDREDAP